MKYRLLGNSGLRVSEAALGTMTFGEDWGWGTAKDEARKVYDAFREAGGNFIDTANIYTNGTSESFLGEFMDGHRQSVVLATKSRLLIGPHRHPELESSLMRLHANDVDHGEGFLFDRWRLDIFQSVADFFFGSINWRLSLASDAPPANRSFRKAPMALRAWLAACIPPTALVNPWAMPIHTSSVASTPAATARST